MSETHSKDGREWARLSQLKPGDWVQAYEHFDCGIAGKRLEVKRRDDGPNTVSPLYVDCDQGKHHLDAQLGATGDYLIGFWPVAEVITADEETKQKCLATYALWCEVGPGGAVFNPVYLLAGASIALHGIYLDWPFVRQMAKLIDQPVTIVEEIEKGPLRE